jgi:exonuclease III
MFSLVNSLLMLLAFTVAVISTDSECPVVVSDEDRRLHKTPTFKIMQYNVQWLFVDYYSSSKCPGSGCDWVNETEALTHLNYIADTINILDPDIVNFCEVEGCDELKMLVDAVKSNEYKPYLKKGKDTSTGQNVGMITKIDPKIDLTRTEDRVTYPIDGSTCGYTGAPTTSGVSKHSITEFTINNIDIIFIAAHLIAFPTDKTRCAQREAQAQVLQNMIFDYYSSGYEIIMLGDFNDFDAEVLDLNNNKPLSQALNVLKGISGTYKGKYSLQSVAELLPQTKRFTDWYDKNNDCVSTPNEFSMIDHILVSPFLYNRIVDAYIYQGYAEFCGKYNSDHYPVIVELLL